MRLETVAESFATYRAGVIPKGAPDLQVEECRRAFYAGVYFCLLNLMHNIGDDSTDEEQGIVELEKLKVECETFAASVGMPLPKAEPPAPIVHVLMAGRALCKDGVPAAWPNDERWVDIQHRADATCPDCLRILPQLKTDAKVSPTAEHNYTTSDAVTMRPILQRLGGVVGEALPEGWGFNLLLFTYGKGGSLFYISSAERGDVMAVMREFIQRNTQ